MTVTVRRAMGWWGDELRQSFGEGGFIPCRTSPQNSILRR
jgi:hypothetical protein